MNPYGITNTPVDRAALAVFNAAQARTRRAYEATVAYGDAQAAAGYNRKVRAWAKANGIPVRRGGAVKAAVVAAYEAAR